MLPPNQDLNFEEFNFLINCITVEGIKYQERDLLEKWLDSGQLPHDLKGILYRKLQNPITPILAFRQIQNYLSRQKNTSQFEKIWLAIETVILADGIFSLQEKIIASTIIETIPKLETTLSRLFPDSLIIKNIQEYRAPKKKIITELKKLITISKNSSLKISDQELWVFFLHIQIICSFVPASYIKKTSVKGPILLQSWGTFPNELFNELIDSIINYSEQPIYSPSDCFNEFLLLADADQRYALMNIVRQLMTTQPQISSECINFFSTLVQGKEKLQMIIRAKEEKTNNSMSIGSEKGNDLVLPASVCPAHYLTIQFNDESFAIFSHANVFLKIKEERCQKYQGNDKFLEIESDKFRLYIFPDYQIILYDLFLSRYLSLENYNVFFSQKAQYSHTPLQPAIKQLQATFRSGEFIGIFGPGNSGKSLLFQSLLKNLPSQGQVLLNGTSYFEYYDKYPHEIGFIANNDVLHEQLTVEETFHYTLKLQGIASVSAEIQKQIDHTAELLGFEISLDTPKLHEHIKNLDKGQRKQVLLGTELLMQNKFMMMLDEPTVGLSPNEELHIHQLLRELASQGMLILMTSNSIYQGTLDLMDLALILTKEGELAYFGPASEVQSYFNVDSPEQVFYLLSQHSSSFWQKKYCQPENPYYRKYVVARQRLHQMNLAETSEPESPKTQNIQRLSASFPPVLSPGKKSGWFFQFLTLSQRLFLRFRRDRSFWMATGLQSMALGLILRLLDFPTSTERLILLSIAAVWLGAIHTLRLVPAEYSVFLREQRFHIRISSHTLTLFTLSAAHMFLQCLIVLIVLLPYSNFWPNVQLNFLQNIGIFYIISIVGVALGMMLATLSRSHEQSIFGLFLVIILMIVWGMHLPYMTDELGFGFLETLITPFHWTLAGTIDAPMTVFVLIFISLCCLGLSILFGSLQNKFKRYRHTENDTNTILKN